MASERGVLHSPRFYDQCLGHVFRRHIIGLLKKIRIINTYVLGVMGASVLRLCFTYPLQD